MVSKTIVIKLMKRIQHLIVDQPEFLFSLLQRELKLSVEYAQFLLSLGAIYQNGKRSAENTLLQKGEWIRCHTEPRRFQTHINWNKHILFENDHFVVVDKPPGLPCQASLDNKIENLLFLLSSHYKHELFITHRLDIGTEGLIVLAKTKLFQRAFNQLLELRKVTKIYECLTTGSQLAPSRLTHWMLPHPRAPKILSATCGERETQERWKLCELEILTSETINASSVRYRTVSNSSINYNGNAGGHYDCNYYRLQLLTGRTHQIRAQLSFEKNPILGDQLYGDQKNPDLTQCFSALPQIETNTLPGEPLPEQSKPSLELEQYALRCCELKFHFQGQYFEWQHSRFKNLLTHSKSF